MPRSSLVAPAWLVVGSSAALFACWDFDYEPPAPADASSDARPPPTDAQVPCLVGGYYCGGERLPGDPRSLYRCDDGGAGTLTSTCAVACIVAPPGKDDACSAAPTCVVGGRYCGGDKVNGDPNVLYRCNAGGALSVVTRCARGCQINPNDDDACK